FLAAPVGQRDVGDLVIAVLGKSPGLRVHSKLRCFCPLSRLRERAGVRARLSGEGRAPGAVRSMVSTEPGHDLRRGRSAPRRQRNCTVARSAPERPASPPFRAAPAGTVSCTICPPAPPRTFVTATDPRGMQGWWDAAAAATDARRKRMNPVLRRACATALLAGLLPLALSAQPATNVEAGSGYQLPVPALQALVDAPRPPQASLSPR